MRRFLVVALLAFICSAVYAEDDVPRATVIDGDTDRIPAETVAPKYPRDARRDRIEGEVQVCFDIDRRGGTRRIAVRHSSNRIFEKPSKKAVRRSTFKPLKEDETIQAMKTCRTFIFALEPLNESGDI
ncbi:MAG: energy transducer TonB [Gammaproteobacteria bacterium]|nr:energy transducer TonB [Gammaproteobacteria bacterium]